MNFSLSRKSHSSNSNSNSDGSASEGNTPPSDSSDNSDNPYKRITRSIDAPKIRNIQKKDIEVSISSSKDLTTQGILRAGVIIYTKNNGTTYFCLGVDTQSGNLTDFGGGVKKDETVVEGALRELEEESQGVFGSLSVEDISDSVVFHSHNMAIIFISHQGDKRKIVTEFEKKADENGAPEVCDIVWLTTEQLLESIHGRGRTLYIRVRKLLSKVTSTISNL